MELHHPIISNIWDLRGQTKRKKERMRVQEGSVLKSLNFRIYQSHLGFSIDQTYHIMELVNEWFPSENFRNIDTPFSTESSYQKELLAALPLT